MVKPLKRCAWAEGHELLRVYHDEEWGVPVHDDQKWYEKIVLDGAQAGLSWLTILKKRDAYREALHGFDPARVATLGERDEERLMQNAGIVRNRLKVRSAITNARAFLEVQAEHGSFDAYIWSLVDGQTVQNQRRSMKEVPARTELSDAIAKDLKKRGFTFVGTTIVYAFMQAAGLVNDHVIDCHRYAVVDGAAKAAARARVTPAKPARRLRPTESDRRTSKSRTTRPARSKSQGSARSAK